MQTIKSIKDEKIILARAVGTRKGRKEHRRVLLEGAQIIDWALAHGLEVEYILAVSGVDPALLERYSSKNIEMFLVSEGIQKKVTNTRYLIPVVGVGGLPDNTTPVQDDFVLVLDDVKDFGNLGTIVRTGTAFGVQQLLNTNSDSDLFQKKTIEASRGSVFSTQVLDFHSSEAVIHYLHEKGYQIVATSPRGNLLQSMTKLDQRPVALVIGNESHGVSREFEEQADLLIQIPMSPDIESLNVGVAAGISVYELRLKQVFAMIEEKIKSTLGRELNVAGMLVQQALDAELKKVTDLNSQQVVFMMVLKCDRIMTVEAMCRQFGLLAADVDAFLAPLLADGLIVQDGDLSLTEKGAEVLAKLWFTVEKTERLILDGIPDEEAQVLKRHLRTIQGNSARIMGEG